MPLLENDIVDIDALAYAADKPPAARGIIRVHPDDFRVAESAPFEPSGEGEHLWCHIEKCGLTTPQAADRLARAVGVHPKHVGYAGLKDRYALTTQWLSLPWPIRKPLPAIEADESLCVLEYTRHDRKLRRGMHGGNRFDILVRDLENMEAETLAADLARIAADGVPNYFGGQRFGRGGRNIELSRALFAGRRLPRVKRGFALSAARSLLFNAVVDARVRAGNWHRLLNGDVLMLAGTQSVFAASATEEKATSLAARVKALDLHPTGPMPGNAADVIPDHAAGALENKILGEYADLVDGLKSVRIDAERRALRLPVADIEARFEDDALRVRFSLPSGAFATSVLRELVQVRDGGQ